MGDKLDTNALLQIVSRLGRARDVATVERTCTYLASVCRSNVLWQGLLERDFGVHVTATGPQGTQSVDLESTYKSLATAGDPYTLRFSAVFTDGGCDEMHRDMTYWADHVFQPNHWSPHCSDGSKDINIIGLLQLSGTHCDMFLSSHRAYLVQRCAPAAAVLFSPPHGPQQTVAEAAKALDTWSTVGLERLYMDLYQDLVQHQHQSTWGKLLLKGLKPLDLPTELKKLTATAQNIADHKRGSWYREVKQVPFADLQAAAAAAAQRISSNSSTNNRLADAAQLASYSGSNNATWQSRLHHGSFGNGAAANAATVAAFRAAATERVLKSPSELSIREVNRHLLDGQLLSWLQHKTACRNATAVVQEVVVSRVGHFTCPVSAGAVLLGQHPGTAAGTFSTAAAAGGTTDIEGTNASPQDTAAVAAAAAFQPDQANSALSAPEAADVSAVTAAGSGSGSMNSTGKAIGSGSSSNSSTGSSTELQQVVLMKHDPVAAALQGATLAEHVWQAVLDGLLPPILNHTKLQGAEWIEFAPLSTEQRAARHQQGWHLQPLVWFRFWTPPAPQSATAGAAGAAGAAAAAVLGAAADWGPAVPPDQIMGPANGGVQGMAGPAGALDNQQPQLAVAAAAGDGMQLEAVPPAAAGMEQPPGQAEAANCLPQQQQGDEDAAADEQISDAFTDAVTDVTPNDDQLLSEAQQAATGVGSHNSSSYEDVQSEVLSDTETSQGTSAGEHAMVANQHSAMQEHQERQQQQHDGGPEQQAASVQQHWQHLVQWQQQQAGPSSGTSPSCAAAPEKGLGSSSSLHGSKAAAAAAGSSGVSPRDSSGRAGVASFSAHPRVSCINITPPPPHLQEFSHEGPAQHLLLCMRLLRPRSGNVVMIKLLNSEDKMDEFEDPSEEPNIDIQYVALRGVGVRLVNDNVALL